MELGRSIKKYRKQLSMSQEQLAEKVFVSRQTISSWENDKSYPDIHSLVLLAEIFQTPVDKLIKGDYEMMKAMVSNEDRSEFRKWGNLFAVLLIVTMVSAVPLIFLLDWTGIIIWTVISFITMVVAFWVDKLKKRYEIRTYKEIASFMEGKKLDEIQKAREDGKYIYQKGYILILVVFISIVIAYGMIKQFS